MTADALLSLCTHNKFLSRNLYITIINQNLLSARYQCNSVFLSKIKSAVWSYFASLV